MLRPVAVPYRRVCIAHAWCESAAGSAAQTWQRIAAHDAGVAPHALSCADGGWVGRCASPPDWELALTRTRVHVDSNLDTALSASASKPECAPPHARIALDWWHAGGAQAVRGLGLKQARTIPVAAACSTGLYGLLAVADALEHDRCAQAVALAVDRPLAPLLLAGYRQLGVWCGTRTPGVFPSDLGFAPGEGAAGVVMHAHGAGWRVVAGVRAADAEHATAFCDPQTLYAACHALWELAPHPELIVLHATGTARGDAYEAQALDAGPWREAQRLSCKPVIGHTLGASGLVELAVGLHSQARSLWKLSMGFGGHLALIACRRDVLPCAA